MNRSIQHNQTDTFLNSFNAKRTIKGANILDSGCGDAYASVRFIGMGANHVTAYDPYDFKCECYDVKLTNLTFKSVLKPLTNVFDIIWSHHVIEHIPNPIEYLQSLKSQLRETGELWLGCPNTAKTCVFAAGHLHNFTIANLVLCLQEAEFPVRDMSWLVHKGQLRIRVSKNGDARLPQPFIDAILRNTHFDVGILPQSWRW